MKVEETKLEGVLIIEPDVFGDSRGFFLETYQKERYEEHGIKCDFVQDNHSRSVKGTIRGLHFQVSPAQDKLVRVTRGRVFDVAVDIRKDSPTFGEWVGVDLSEENKKQLFVPIGFAHGFCALEDTNDFEYKCSSYYNPKTEIGIAWNDPDIGVEWPIENPILSERDKNNQSFQEYKKSPAFKYRRNLK